MFFVAAAIVAILLAALLYQWIGARRDRSRYPSPGKLYEASGARLHARITGDAGPSVVFESGIAASSLSWSAVEALVSSFARVAVYDRAGLGWSEPSRKPRTLTNIADELHALLDAAALPRPWLLVGHSFGGLIVRAFAARYPDDVAALVLVDPVPVADWFPLTDAQSQRLARGVRLSSRGALLAQFGVVRLALSCLLSGSNALPKLFAKLAGGRGAKVTGNLAREVSKMPRELWPLVAMHWRQPKSFRAMADYLAALPDNAKAAAAIELPPELPAIVLTSDYERADVFRGAEYRRFADAGHWIQLDRPEAVAEAIRDALALSQRRSPVPPEECAASAEAVPARPSSPPQPGSR